MKADNKISYKHGFFLPMGGLIFGGTLLLISVKILSNPANIFQICLGAVVLLGGIFLFSTKGLDIDTDTKKMKAYTKVFGIKTGKEASLNDFKFITIINQGYAQSSFSRTGAEVRSSFSKYNILLLNDTHHLKQLVQSFDLYVDAQEKAKQLSEQLNFEIVKYDPVRTRGRRK